MASPDLPDVLRGPRLDLVLVSVEQLLARAEADGPVPLGVDDPTDVLHPDRSPLHYRVKQVREDPAENPWLLRLAIDRGTGELVGYGNFHARPDAEGMVEIGYTVLPEFRRRGYGREIAETLWRAAVGHPDVRVLRASVAPDNEASLAIVKGAGLVEIGEQWDEEDGLELVLEVPASEVRLTSSE